MEFYLGIAEVVLAALLIVTIIIQNKGAGLGGAFGSDSTIYSTRRGPEQSLFITTIVLAILFIGVAFAHIFIV